jgi:hypothetical protein
LTEDESVTYQKDAIFPVGRVHSDNGGEFKGTEFLKFLDKMGIKKTFTTAYTAQSNGVVERSIRTIFEMASSLLNHSGLPAHKFWPEAIEHAVYLRNRIPHSKTQVPPVERFTGLKVTGQMINSLGAFGAQSYATITKESAQGRDRSTFSPKATSNIYLGASSNRRAAVLYDLEKGEIHESKDIKVFNDVFPYANAEILPEDEVKQPNMEDTKHVKDNTRSTVDSSSPYSQVERRDGVYYCPQYGKADETGKICEYYSYRSATHVVNHMLSQNHANNPATSNQLSGSPQTYLPEEPVFSEHIEQKLNSENVTPSGATPKAQEKTPVQSISPPTETKMVANAPQAESTTLKVAEEKNNITSAVKPPVSTQTVPVVSPSPNTSMPRTPRKTSSSETKATAPTVTNTTTVTNSNTQKPVFEPRRSQRLAEKNLRSVTINGIKLLIAPAPGVISMKEAMNSPDKPKFEKAMDKEMDSHKENGVYEQVAITMIDLKKHIVLPTCWILSYKLSQEELIEKARLVVRGDFQRANSYNPQSLFAPTVATTSVRIMFAVAAFYGWKIDHIDFQTAFLNAPLKEEIYISLPKAYGYDPKTVLRLKKSLYGLRQSPHNWHETLKAELIKLQFRAMVHDPCVFRNDKTGVIITLHVDDVQITAKDPKDSAELKIAIQKLFKIKDLGEIKNFLSLQVQNDEKSVFLHQKPLIEELITDLELENHKTPSSPAPSNSLKAESKEICPNTEYRSLVGRLTYLATHTRPDISLCLMLLARKSQNPTKGDYYNLLQIAGYLKGTITHGPHYNLCNASSSEEVPVYAYTDASHASIDMSHSVTGSVIMVNGGPVLWIARKQETVAKSSTTAELIAAYNTAQEAVTLGNLLDEMKIKRTKPIPVYTDNQSLVHSVKQNFGLSKSPLRHECIKLAGLREFITNGLISLIWRQGKDNLADILTKPINGAHHHKLTEGLLNLTSGNSK